MLPQKTKKQAALRKKIVSDLTPKPQQSLLSQDLSRDAGVYGVKPNVRALGS